MFRMIALSLVATFTLLGWLGADGTPPQAQQRTFGIQTTARGASAAGDLAIGQRYIAGRVLALHSRPETSAPVVRKVGEGTPLLVIGHTGGDFAQVRDPDGQRGYARLSALTPVTPTGN